ncbi:MAG: hypothetical protein AB7G28_08275 [Pirellulales bacterium]
MSPDNLDRLLELERELWDAQRYSISVDGVLEVELAALGGVYAIWCGEVPKYVGETTHLKHRLSDIVHGKHGFRQKPVSVDMAVFARDYRLSFLADILGRSELEEFLFIKWFGLVPGRLNCRSDYEQMVNAKLLPSANHKRISIASQNPLQ